MKKILIPHSWSPSIGDMAVLSSITKMLHTVIPDAEITALVSHPQFTRKKCPTLKARLEMWPWPLPKRDTGMLEIASYPFILLSHFISAVVYRLTKARIFIFNRRFSGPLSAFFDCDVVLSPGGDFISPKYGFITTFSEFIISRILGKRLIICAQTIGPFEGLLNRRVAATALNLADLIIVREKKTARLLKEIGIDDFHITADVVFTTPQIERKKKMKKVLICAEKLDSASQRKTYVDYLRKLTERIINELGCEVVYFPANGADVAFQGEIISKMPGVSAIPEVLSPEKAAEMISEADFLISSRMHPIILGTLSATPFFSIGDSFKFEEVLGVFYKGSSAKIRELDDRRIEIVLERIRQKRELSKLIEKRFPMVKERAMGNASILSEKFEEWGIA